MQTQGILRGGGRSRALRIAVALGVPLATVVGTGELVSSEAAAYQIRGSVACSGSVSGTWMQSSGGGSGFATWTAYPRASSIARVARSFSTTLPSTIYLNVGCGGTPAAWGSSNRTPSRTVTRGSTLFINTECNALGSCAFFPMENNTPPAPTTNPGFDPSQCTWRASEYFRLMTGRYPNWGGDAHLWDDNAAATGWAVRSWPRPDSIAVWQSNQAGARSEGHVGYVADTRVASGKLQMLIYDRNWGGKDRNGVWVDFVSGMKFIVVPPRVG